MDAGGESFYNASGWDRGVVGYFPETFMERAVSEISPAAEVRPQLSIVVPVHRRPVELRPLVSQLGRTFASLEVPYEVIVVACDGGRGIEQEVAALASEGHPIRVVALSPERGDEAGVVRGLAEARGDVLICMDGRARDPASAIPRMLRALDETGAELVIATPHAPGGGWEDNGGVLGWIVSRSAMLLALPLGRTRDPMSGFFALRRSIYRRSAPLDRVGSAIALELLVKCRIRKVREVPIEVTGAARGTRTVLRELVGYVRDLKRLADFKFGALSRFFQFCMVGTSGMVVDLSGYALLLYLKVPLGGARALAIWVAMTWNFFLNRRMTFSDSRDRSAWSQYPRFVASCILGALLSWSVNMLVVTQVSWFGVHLLLAAFIGILVGTISNFLFSHLWVFKRS